MVDPMTLTWSELIAEFVRRTGQEGVANPIKPDVKDLVSYARNLGLICNGTFVTITDRTQVRQLLEAIPLPPETAIDFSDEVAPAPPPKKRAAPTTPARVAPSPRLRCSATKADGSGQCRIEGANLEVDMDGKPFCDIPKHHDQGNWSKPATVHPVVMTEDEIRAKLQDIIDNRAGKSRHELRDLMNHLLRKLPGFEAMEHASLLFEVRMKMLDLKLEPAKFRWADVKKASEPKGTVTKASSATSSTGPASGSKSPAKKSPSTKAAKKAPKTSGSKGKKATPKTPQPAATAPTKKKGAKSAPNLKKGFQMPSSADINAAALLKLQANADADSEAFSWFRTWQDQPNDAFKRAVADSVPKPLKKRFAALVKKHEAEEGDDTKVDSKLAKAVAKLTEGKKGKKKLTTKSIDKLLDEGYDGDDIDAALEALNKKGA